MTDNKARWASTFRPHRPGLQRILGELECQIMEALWQRSSCKGREVYEELARQRPVAYTTVLTVADRLAAKGLIIKRKGSDNNYLYRAAYSQEELTGRVSREVLASLMKLSGSGVMASFVDLMAEIDPEQMELLHQLVEERLEEPKDKGGDEPGK